MTMSLRDAEMSPDLSCIQEQAREVVDQIALAQVLSGMSSLLYSSKKGSGATGPQKTLSTQPPPLLPQIPSSQFYPILNSFDGRTVPL